MGLRRYTASADNTITNAFQANMTTRGTGANCGEADVLEAFSIYGRETTYGPESAAVSAATASQELSRILIQFPIEQLTADRNSGIIPKTGSVSFYLRMFNAQHSKTVPRNFKMVALAVSRSWDEGTGLDLEGYKDLVQGSKSGSNWMICASGTKWDMVGGDYRTGSSHSSDAGKNPIYTQTMTTGLEDIEIDITALVELWMAGTVGNYGLGVHLTGNFEAYASGSASLTSPRPERPFLDSGSVIHNPNGAKTSYYTKRFFARGTEFFFKRPVIEARWDSVRRDDRGEFYYSSSLAAGDDNRNVLFFYNYIRGRLTDIPGLGNVAGEKGKISVSLYSGSADNSGPSGSKLELSITDDGLDAGGVRTARALNATGGLYKTGIYTCSLALTSSSQTAAPLTLYDVWHTASTSTGVITELFTGSIETKRFSGHSDIRDPIYYLNITNLRTRYYPSDRNVRFNLYVREKNWSPTIYTKATATAPSVSIMSASYRVFRTLDGYEAVKYGTGSNFSTGLSHDVSGNYFDFDMQLLEPGYEYAFKFAFYDPELKSWNEQDEKFKFRVEDYEY